MGKVYDGIMGLVVADAVGVPVEFMNRDTFKVTDMIGYGTYNQPPGTWSDDSSLTLATVESLGRLGKIDLNDIMKNFFFWFNCAEFTPHDEVFDVGRTTRKAIAKYYSGEAPEKCGGRSEMDNGNGSLMRILPIAFVPHTFADVIKVSRLTHGHRISISACEIYISIADGLIAGKSIKEAISDRMNGTYYVPDEFQRLKNIELYSRDEIKSSGYVVDTLEAALWCLVKTNSYRECVLMAVNLGEDTDTVAAVAGGLAGIYYGCGGEKGIPDEWIAQIARKDWIENLCSNLEVQRKE